MKFATYLVVTIAIVPPLIAVYLNTGARLFQPEAVTETATTQRVTIPVTSEPSGSETVLEASTERQPVNAAALPLSAIRPVQDIVPSVVEPLDTSAESADVELMPAAPVELEIVVKLSEDSWVEITAGDAQRLEYDLLRSDQERVYRGQPPFDILLGRASAVELLVDGVPLTYEGHDRGDVAQLQVDADGARLR